MSDLNSYEEGLAVDLALAESRIKELEAKLAKAMRHVAEYSNDPHLVGWARRNLAELTGGDNGQDS